jgi:transposase
MITVDQYNYIRTAHRVYGKKIRAIARDTGHSRNTVRKALSKEHCGYSARKDQPYPVLGQYLDIIDRWLKGDKDKPKKQRHTAKRIYSRLCYEHGFKGSDRTVRKYVHDARRLLGLDNSLVFIPLDPELGFEAEVDWGTSHAILAGEYVKLKMFCMRSKGSGKHFVQCFPCERQQALFEGHIQAFDFFSGVFSTLIYDNLTTAVDKVLRGRDRKLHESFLKFQAYYNFTPRFCNPGQGHEKGGVEGLVGYARRNYMVPIPEAQGLEELNRRLLEECLAYGNHRMSGREETVNELYEKEKRHLLPIPGVRFSNIETFSGKVDKYSTMIMDKNRYSVPTRYVAFESARPIRQWREVWPECLERLLGRFCEKQGHTRGTKDFINVLMLFKEHKKEDVVSAVEEAISAGVSSSEAVEHILISRIAPVEHSPVPLDNWETLSPPDVSVYSSIGGVL